MNQQIDIYNMVNADFIKAQGLDKTGKRLSVYIPSVHISYDNITINNIFQMVFGTVCRIDSVYNQTNQNFKSIFVYYYENAFLTANRGALDVQPNGAIKIYPYAYTQYTRRVYGTQKEYWLVFENTSTFPDTTLSLDEISERMHEMERKLIQDSNAAELEILHLNIMYINCLYEKQNRGNYYDAPINVHQLAQNIKLMEERYVASLPATEEPAIEEPAIEEPATEEPATEEPATEEPAIEEPAIEEPATEECFSKYCIGPLSIQRPVDPDWDEIEYNGSYYYLKNGYYKTLTGLPTPRNGWVGYNIGEVNYLVKCESTEIEKKREIYPPIPQFECDQKFKNSIFIENLSPECDEAELWDHFFEFGNLLSIVICKHPVTKESLLSGYVNYQNSCDAESAFKSLTENSEKRIINNKICKISWNLSTVSLVSADYKPWCCAECGNSSKQFCIYMVKHNGSNSVLEFCGDECVNKYQYVF